MIISFRLLNGKVTKMHSPDKKSLQKFYQTQNITIRKSIRQLDMGYDTFSQGSQAGKRSDINILVVGPPSSGKSTLLRTMHYALNGSLACYVESRNIGDTSYERYEVKKNRRCMVDGLVKVKETDEKLGVYGYEVNYERMGSEFKNPMDKYARAVEMMNSRSLGCISHSSSNSGLGAINYVIICLNMVQKLSQQQVLALRYFITEIDQKRIKFNIVGTHLDQIMGRDSVSLSSSYASSLSNNGEEEKMVYVEEWKKFIQAELCPKILTEVYCMENYACIAKKQQFQNSETVNYYSLTLLEKCIKRAPESEKSKKVSLKLFCF